MRVECSICNKTYANKSSLYSHKNKYHQNMDKNSNDRKVLLPNPTIMDGNRKRSRSSDISEASESDNDVKVKRIKTEESDDDKFNEEINQKLVRVVAKLIKEVNQMHITVGKVVEDIDKAGDKIDENKRNITRERMFKQIGS